MVKKKSTPQAASPSLTLGLAIVTSITGDIEVTPTHYTVNGHIIPRTVVVAVVGTTIYYRATLNMGQVAQVLEVRGHTVYINTDEEKIVVFDQSLLTVSAGVSAPSSIAARPVVAASVEEDAEEEVEVEEEVIAPAPKATKKKTTKAAPVVEEVEEDEEEVVAPVPKATKKKAAPAPEVDDDEEISFDLGEDDDAIDLGDEEDAPVTAPKRTKQVARVAEDEDDEEEVIAKPVKKAKKAAPIKDEDEDLSFDELDLDEDDAPPAKAPKKAVKAAVVEEEEDEDYADADLTFDDEEDEPVKKSSKKSTKAAVVEEEDDEYGFDADDAPPTSSDDEDEDFGFLD